MAKPNPFVRVVCGTFEFEDLDLVALESSPQAVVWRLDGRGATNVRSFYSRIAESVPLIRGFGENPNALLDLFRSIGFGPRAGHDQVFVWFRPELMLSRDRAGFCSVLDIVVGVAKELLFGEENDPEFDAMDDTDWVPTRLDVVLVCQERGAALEIAQLARELSPFWSDTFSDLTVEVIEEDFERIRGAP